MIQYNIDISLMIQYLNGIFMIFCCSQEPNFVQFISFNNLADKLQTSFFGDVQVPVKSLYIVKQYL